MQYFRGEACLLTVGAVLLTAELSYSLCRCSLDGLSHCKSKTSTASQKAPIVRKKALIASRKAPNTMVSKEALL